MPARVVEYPCGACNGNGYLSRKPCGLCVWDGHCVVRAIRKIILEASSQQCSVCGGRNVIDQVCASCQGRGRFSDRMWLPDDLNETFDMLADLEQAVNEGGGGAWILLNALRAAHAHCEATRVADLFPEGIVDRLICIESQLPLRCSVCEGRGIAKVGGVMCASCGGSGCLSRLAHEAEPGAADVT